MATVRRSERSGGQDFTVKLPRKLIDDLKATAGGIAESWYFQVSMVFFFLGGCYVITCYIIHTYIYIVYEIHTYTYILFMIYIYTQINYSSLDHGIKQLRLIELVFIHMFIYST